MEHPTDHVSDIITGEYFHVKNGIAHVTASPISNAVFAETTWNARLEVGRIHETLSRIDEALRDAV